MPLKLSALCIVLLACLSPAIALQTDSEAAKAYLNAGIQDYKAFHYESAVEHLKQAHKLDPQSRRAALYLAASLAEEYIPGVNTPDNLNLGNEAIEAYKQVLALDSQNVNALKSIATLEFEMKKFEEANSYYRQATQAAPDDPETFYCVAVVDWIQAYMRRAAERKKQGLRVDGPSSITQSFCPKLRAANLPLIEDGMQALKKAMELRPDYDDAMVYLDLLYIERAEVQCNNKAARSSDELQAGHWVENAMEARKRRAEKGEDQAPEKSKAADDLEPPPPLPLAPPPPPPRPR